ncbi:uncharacterized protein RAG0_12571 [Rhynchosporium agropyri]|uniref:Tc1-like transposase DDE domain-containing protein n=1 Tax=Rhynchosporium agropyri TaxID=914238 RepID=A0A1E1L9F6_9HELO|nr:uncharacterized protein RAG0_12571 [Rhynchosporium agropyri]
MKESFYSVPIPKTPRKQCTRDNRLRIENLYFEAGFTQAELVLQLNLTLVGSYSGIIIPVVQEVLQQYPELQFQQDNTKGHISKYVKSVFEAIGITSIFWPANSPGLNPIETLWDLMKDYLEERSSVVHRSCKRLREAVQEAWDLITQATIPRDYSRNG